MRLQQSCPPQDPASPAIEVDMDLRVSNQSRHKHCTQLSQLRFIQRMIKMPARRGTSFLVIIRGEKEARSYHMENTLLGLKQTGNYTEAGIRLLMSPE